MLAFFSMSMEGHSGTVATRQKAALNSIQQLQVDSGYWAFFFLGGSSSVRAI